MIVCSGFASSSRSLRLSSSSFSSGCPTRPSRAPALGTRRSMRAAPSRGPPSRPAARPGPGGADLGADLQVLRDGTASRARRSPQARSARRGSMRTWKCRWPGSTETRAARLAVRQRPVGLAEHLQHLQAQRVAGAFCPAGRRTSTFRLRLGGAHCSSLTAAARLEDLDRNRGSQAGSQAPVGDLTRERPRAASALSAPLTGRRPSRRR